MHMYYNLTTEERYILTLSDTMLKEGYTVDEVIEFLQCEDMDQVECILGTLTLTESVDVDHPDLGLVVEGIGSRIGSWLVRQSGRLKGAFSKGSSQVTKLQPTKVKVTNPDKGLFYGIRKRLGLTKKSKNITGDVVKKGSKLKTTAKVAAGAGAVALVGAGLNSVVNNSGSDSGDTEGNSNQPTTTTTTNANPSPGSQPGGRTRAYGWWKRSHASSPYVDTDHFKNIRRTTKQSEK